MPDLYKEIVLELESRKVGDARDLAPFYISSMATHQLNIVNQKKRLYTEGGIPVNMRQHVLYVAPPGFGKSYYVKQFLEHEDYSILKGVNSFPSFFEGQMTEAGLIGTVLPPAAPGQPPRRIYGLAGADGMNAIVGMEEFAAITNVMSQEFNAGMDAALLTLLDSGIVNKRLANGDLKYNSNMTWWVGTQPARFDLSSGLARRFIFLVKYPTWYDFDNMKKRRRAAKNVVKTQSNTKALHDLLDARFHQIRNNVSSIIFHDDFYKALDKKRIVHYEEALYERIAIGYWLMKEYNLNGALEVRMDPELQRILDLEHGYRKKIKKGPLINMVWTMVKDLEKIDKKTLKDQLLDVSIDYDEAETLIRTLITLKYLRFENGLLYPVKK